MPGGAAYLRRCAVNHARQHRTQTPGSRAATCRARTILLPFVRCLVLPLWAHFVCRWFSNGDNRSIWTRTVSRHALARTAAVRCLRSRCTTCARFHCCARLLRHCLLIWWVRGCSMRIFAVPRGYSVPAREQHHRAGLPSSPLLRSFATCAPFFMGLLYLIGSTCYLPTIPRAALSSPRLGLLCRFYAGNRARLLLWLGMPRCTCFTTATHAAVARFIIHAVLVRRLHTARCCCHLPARALHACMWLVT